MTRLFRRIRELCCSRISLL